MPIQGFFQALCQTIAFVFQIEFEKAEGFFLCRRHEEISRGSAECCKPHSIGPGQSTGAGPRGKALGNLAFLGFEYPLL